MTNAEKIKHYLWLKLPVVAALSLLLAFAVSLAVSAWGPDRKEFTIQSPATYVTFNSIKNNPAHGDEKNFMQVREATASNSTYADKISLQPGKEYVVYVYYHNNAASNYNASGVGVATGAYVKAEIPSLVKSGSTTTKGVGYVGASNAKHIDNNGVNHGNSVWDDIVFENKTAADIALRYVPGSATIHSKGPVNGKTMSDSIVTSGASIGYDKLDGRLPGCNEYAGYVTFRVKADQPNFTVTKQVRKDGDKSWKASAEGLKPSDTVQYLISYKNTGTTQQNGVIIKDALPKGLTYINGSSVLTNTSNPSGKSIADGVTAGGIKVGDYAPGATAYVTFKAKVASKSDFKCGNNVLKNTATVQTSNGTKTGDASITVTVECKSNECKPGIPKGDSRCEKCTPKDGEVVDKDGNCVPAALPTTGPAQIVAGILGVTFVSLGVAYWIRSRHEYKRALAGFTEDFTEEPQEELLTARTEDHRDSKHLHK